MATKRRRTTAHFGADAEVKQRQTPHRSDVARPLRPALRGQAGSKPRDNRARARARDAARHPKKYFVAQHLASEPAPRVERSRRRTAAAPGRAPVVGQFPLVRDVMVGDVVTIDASSTLREAARRMRDSNVGMLPVLVDGRLRGVLTDRDLVVRALAGDLDGATPVAEIVSGEAITGRPEWSTQQAMTAMANAQIGRLPIVDDRGAVLGIVTLGSLVLRSREQEDVLEAAKEVSRRSARREPSRGRA
jgi:CBS domain-containing protein